MVAALREELTKLGRADLARSVRHVSIESDQLGYDVWAPKLTGDPRLIEVKTTTVRGESESIEVTISRNEYDTGVTRPNWVLLICEVASSTDRSLRRLRWCPGSALLPFAPVDSSSSKWASAHFRIPADLLRDGLPAATT